MRVGNVEHVETKEIVQNIGAKTRKLNTPPPPETGQSVIF